jgi:hypothetical protein
MSFRTIARYAIAAAGGLTMLALAQSPASAFTLSAPSLEAPVVSAQVDKVWWHGGWGWHHHWGWHRPWAYGYGYGWGGPHCWRNYWGQLRCNY